MGVQLKELVKGETIGLEQLKNKKIAIDAFNWLYQFLSIIRDRETGEPLRDSKGRITSHLSRLLYRTARLIEAGVKPIYVFDGTPPHFKKSTTLERVSIRQEAHARWMEAKSKGDIEEIRKASQAALFLTGDMIEQSKNLLQYMGVPVIQAPSEGEAECAFLCKNNLVYSTASQDSDSLLFGSTRLIKNLSISGKRKLPKKNVFVDVLPEIIVLKDILSNLNLKREQLIIIGLLIGGDYNPGIKGIGPKRALDLVKKEKTLNKVLKKVEWNSETPANEIYEFYMEPPAKTVEIKFSVPQPQKLLKMMVDEHGFSLQRVEKVIKNISDTKSGQKSLWS